ncbi:MAG: hypothetical protein AAF376_13355 [Pseudomonadota bacterium]
MTIPDLKRVKIAAEAELQTWLAKHPHYDAPVMVLTVADRRSTRHVTRDRIAAVAADHRRLIGPRYTLNGGLVGTVIEPPRA